MMGIAGALLSLTTLAQAQTANTQADSRDYEALALVPNNTVAAIAYGRHVSSSDKQSYSQDLGILRAVYIMKFGRLAIVPVDLVQPIVDDTIYVPTKTPGVVTTLHASGLADMTWQPTIGYSIAENETTHTYFAGTLFVSPPTGSYSAFRPVNFGDNRWRTQPLVAVGQRFLKKVTAELDASIAFYTSNPAYGTPTETFILKQNPSIGFEAHVGVDITPTFFLLGSYYVQAAGQRTLTLGSTTVLFEPEQTTQTLRFSYGIHIEKNSALLLQYNQDIAVSSDTQNNLPASISRFVGARFTHAMFL
jgi:outer membrane putative beta-barrel porin/alpha-amylase